MYGCAYIIYSHVNADHVMEVHIFRNRYEALACVQSLSIRVPPGLIMKWAPDCIKLIIAIMVMEVLENSTIQACLVESHRAELYSQ